MINDEIDQLDTLKELEAYKDKLSNNNLSTHYINKVVGSSYNITLSKDTLLITRRTNKSQIKQIYTRT